jgi:Uncharacterized protein conserved in bacteria
MLNIGKINTLSVVRKQGADIYLANGISANVLLADRKPPENCQVGDTLDVFVYVDSEGHLAASTKIPLHRLMILLG